MTARGALIMVMAGVVMCGRFVRRGHHRFVMMRVLRRWHVDLGLRLALAAHARRRAQHRRSHGTADGQQHGKQEQQADAEGFQVRRQRPI